MKSPLLVLAGLCFLLAGSAVAQDCWTTRAKITVPFDFVVSSTTLPAGSYAVSTLGIDNSVMIQNLDKADYAKIVQNNNIVMNPSATLKETKLVFLKDNQHVLHQIYIAGDNHVHDILHGYDVVEIADELAAVR